MLTPCIEGPCCSANLTDGPLADRSLHLAAILLRFPRATAAGFFRFGAIGYTLCPTLGNVKAQKPGQRVAGRLVRVHARVQAAAELPDVVNLGSDDADALCERLNLSGEWKRIIQGVAKIKDEIDKLADPSIPASHIYRFFKRYPAEAVSACLIANDSQIIRSQIERYLNDLQYMQTALNGDDLKAMGMEPGPRLGRMLSSLRDAKMDGVVRTREDEEALVRQRLQNQ